MDNLRLVGSFREDFICDFLFINIQDHRSCKTLVMYHLTRQARETFFQLSSRSGYAWYLIYVCYFNKHATVKCPGRKTFL